MSNIALNLRTITSSVTVLLEEAQNLSTEELLEHLNNSSLIIQNNSVNVSCSLSTVLYRGILIQEFNHRGLNSSIKGG